MTLTDLLSEKKISKIKSQIYDGIGYHGIRQELPELQTEGIQLLKEFIEHVKNPGISLGNQSEPYLKDEEPIEPLYTWETLSDHEKEFYHENDERLRKTKLNFFKKQ